MLLRIKDGRWKVDIQPGGRNSRRYRKLFATKGEALRFQSLIEKKHAEGLEWNPQGSDRRRLSALVQTWYMDHGQHLRDGPARQRALVRGAMALGDPIAAKLNSSDFLSYRNRRISYDPNKKSVSPKTLNNELSYFKALFSHLISTGQITYPHPLISVKPIKISERELSFLSIDQVQELLTAIERTSENQHLLLIVKLCLATGCRWSEAESLHRRQIEGNQVTFTNTKSGKNRTVPIEPTLTRELTAHSSGKLFTSSLNAFRKALSRTTITLPPGQSSHVLRHTYASHFVMNGGDIRTLQLILGHSTLNVTMKYAHLSPKHLSGAAQLSPLSKLTTK